MDFLHLSTYCPSNSRSNFLLQIAFADWEKATFIVPFGSDSEIDGAGKSQHFDVVVARVHKKEREMPLHVEKTFFKNRLNPLQTFVYKTRRELLPYDQTSCFQDGVLLQLSKNALLETGMYLGKVLGRVVCSHKDVQMHGLKLLIVTAVDGEGKPRGKPFIAVDSAGAGAGETVFLCGGGEAALPFAKQRPPSDATILGIVDKIG